MSNRSFIHCIIDQQGSVETSIDAANRGDNHPNRRKSGGTWK